MLVKISLITSNRTPNPKNLKQKKDFTQMREKHRDRKPQAEMDQSSDNVIRSQAASRAMFAFLSVCPVRWGISGSSANLHASRAQGK